MKKPTSKLIKLAGIFVAIICILFIAIGAIGNIAQRNAHIRDQPLMYGQHAIMLTRQTLGSQNNLRYFSSMDEAIAAYWNEDILATKDEVIRFEVEGKKMIFFAAEDWTGIPHIAVCFFR